MKEAAASRVSYVRKPFAIRSRMSILLALAALSLGGAGIYQGVVTQGQAALVSGALGFCSIFLSVLALWYGGISFLEDDKNYILAKLGIALSVLLLAGWTAVITIGLGG
ncbi:MAG: calcium:proton exchanger [Hungatella sp.]|nr:calcium:proton exchanger [Hungatella sp.]